MPIKNRKRMASRAPVAVGPVQVGYTFYTDPPPGAGNLSAPGFHYAELGTANRITGSGTGVGHLANALGRTGELPMGFKLRISANGKSVVADKQDRGYGQGGDGYHSDPSYAIDLWSFPGHDLRKALGLSGKGQVTIAPVAPGDSVGSVVDSVTGAMGDAASAVGGAVESAANAATGGALDVLGTVKDLLTTSLADLAAKLAVTVAGFAKDVVIGFVDLVILPAWHWNQRTVDYFMTTELAPSAVMSSGDSQWVFISTAGFWGLGYVLLFTDPDAKGAARLKPAPVHRSRLARHVRSAQAVPARRELVKPGKVKERTAKKPPEVESVTKVEKVNTLKATRPRMVKVTNAGNGPDGPAADGGTEGGAPVAEDHTVAAGAPDGN